jgi:hypothetical protein
MQPDRLAAECWGLCMCRKQPAAQLAMSTFLLGDGMLLYPLLLCCCVVYAVLLLLSCCLLCADAKLSKSNNDDGAKLSKNSR